MIDNLFPCDIGAFVTIRETIVRLRTIGLICVLAFGLLAASLPAEAQQAGKVYRIGWLGPTGRGKSEAMAYVKPFLDQLQKLGWVEGKQFLMEYRSPQGKSKRLPSLAAELVRLKVDVIVTITSGAAGRKRHWARPAYWRKILL